MELGTGENEIYRLAIVVGPDSNRKEQEISMFRKLSHFNSTYVYSPGRKHLNMTCRNYKFTQTKKLLPDFMSDLFVRRPYSPVSMIKLESLDDYLRNIDIINCIELYSFISSQCSKIAKKEKKKLSLSIFETHTAMPLHWMPPFSKNVRTVLRQADIFIAYTNKAKKYLFRLSVPDEKIEVVYPGIDLQTFFPSKESDHENLRILFVSGLAGEKGLSVLLRAFAKLYAERQDIELWICAKLRTERMKIAVHAYAEKYPLQVFNYVEYSKIPDIYRRCDVFCLPSQDLKKWGIKVWEEQFGFALVEAMSSGLPIVTTDCGVIPEIVGPENLIVPQGSVNALFSALSRMIEDSGLRLRLRRLNRARAEEMFDIEKQRAKMDKALLSLVQ